MWRLPNEHPLPSKVTSPAQLRRVSRESLPASLGTLELAIALHYVYRISQGRVLREAAQPSFAHQ
jgi:deoxyxylulose-5-phosphate synthase